MLTLFDQTIPVGPRERNTRQHKVRGGGSVSIRLHYSQYLDEPALWVPYPTHVVLRHPDGTETQEEFTTAWLGDIASNLPGLLEEMDTIRTTVKQ